MRKYGWFTAMIVILTLAACSSASPTTEAAPPEQPASAASEPAAAPVEAVAPTAVSTEAPAQPAAPTVEQAAPTEIVPSAVPAGIDGETLLQERCTRCHNLNRVTSKKASVAQWTSTVERMVQKGAILTDEEKLILIDYLGTTYPN